MKRKDFLSLIIISCLLVALGFIGSFVSSYSAVARSNSTVLGSQKVAPPKYSDPLLQQTVNQINAKRTSNNLPLLRQSPELDALAGQRAADMAQNGYYAHKGSDGKFFSDHMKEQNIPYRFACENLNIASYPLPADYVSSWLDSRPHKQCMLKESHLSAGYAIAKVSSIDGIPTDQTVIVAIYSD